MMKDALIPAPLIGPVNAQETDVCPKERDALALAQFFPSFLRMLWAMISLAVAVWAMAAIGTHALKPD